MNKPKNKLTTKELLAISFSGLLAVSAFSMLSPLTQEVSAQIIVEEGEFACVIDPGNSRAHLVLVNTDVKERIDSGELKPLPFQACFASMNR